MDRLTGIRIFADLARSGSIAATARAFGMSHTMATKHLNALEARLGVRLVHRTTRSLTVTEPGLRYLESAQNWIADIDGVEAALRDAVEMPRGHLRITVPVVLGLSRMTDILAAFLVRYPATTAELDLSDHFVDLVGDGYDLAIRVARRLESPGLIVRKLGLTHLIHCAAPGYLARAGLPETRADLARHNCLGQLAMDRFHRFRWRTDRLDPAADGPSGCFNSANPAAIVTAAIAGLGIVREPDFIVGPHIASGQLQEIALESAEEPLTIYLVMPSRRLVPTRVRLCAEFIAQEWKRTDAASALRRNPVSGVSGG